MKLVSIAKYAELCELDKQTIYNRVKRGIIETQKTKFGLCIDMDKFPASTEKFPVGRPTIDEQLKRAEK